MITQHQKLSIGILPLTLALYDHLIPEIREKLNRFASQLGDTLAGNDLEIHVTPVTAQTAEIRQAYARLKDRGIDLLIVAHLTYAASEEILPVLLDSDMPLLLWPAQPMLELTPREYDSQIMRFNHGMHGTLDLANVLRRHGRRFGVIYRHWSEKGMRENLIHWAKAGRVIQAMKESNPLVIGGYFEGMLDLQLDGEAFLEKLGVQKTDIPLDEYVALAAAVPDADVDARLLRHAEVFTLHETLDRGVFIKAVRHELTLRRLMTDRKSSAVAVNFVETCRHPQIADGLHFGVNVLMAEGAGYAGEGDWVTAMLVRGLQAGLGRATFSEMFSIGYRDSRLVLRHWGEGNYAMARAKPVLLSSVCKDGTCSAEFVVADFEYAPSPRSTLINLNVSPDGRGQLISVTGSVEPDGLPELASPRAVFKPRHPDAGAMLTEYARHGGSHHLAMVNEDCENLLQCIAELLGWVCISL